MSQNSNYPPGSDTPDAPWAKPQPIPDDDDYEEDD